MLFFFSCKESNSISEDSKLICQSAEELLNTRSMHYLYNYRDKLEDRFLFNLLEDEYSVYKNVNIVLEQVIDLIEGEMDYFINVDSFISFDSTQIKLYNWFDTSNIVRSVNLEDMDIVNAINLANLSDYLKSTIVFERIRVDPYYIITNSHKHTICKGDTLELSINALYNILHENSSFELKINGFETEVKNGNLILKFVPNSNDEFDTLSNYFFKTIDVEIRDILNNEIIEFKEPVYVSYKLVECLNK
jgi:DNA polymerase III delta prime subunit